MDVRILDIFTKLTFDFVICWRRICQLAVSWIRFIVIAKSIVDRPESSGQSFFIGVELRLNLVASDICVLGPRLKPE